MQVFAALLEFLQSWLDAVGTGTNHPLVLAALAGTAGAEYVFPPFPGDTVTLLGAILVSAYHWSLVLVFAALMAGSVIGSLIAFSIGHKWQERREHSDESRLSRLVQRFRRHGSWYLVLNRFFPGIRPLFFVAAGLAGMSVRRVLVLSALSAALWNALLMLAGALVGRNLAQLEAWFQTYSTVAWIVIAGVALVLIARHFRRASRAPR